MTSTTKVNRQTVDLSAYPDLIVIYLGMRAKSLRGVATLLSLGRQIARAAAAKPNGLLLHENFMMSLLPPHVGMRQYWSDLGALEAWSRSLPHHDWWTNFLRDPRGTAFWHETYCRSGGFEAIYDDLDRPFGMMRFAPLVPAHGRMFSARSRLGDARGRDDAAAAGRA
jgi:hypothetical protein